MSPQETTISPQALREFYANHGELQLIVLELRAQLAASQIEASTLRAENTEMKATYEHGAGAAKKGG